MNFSPVEYLQQLWKSRETMLEVLTDRGYNLESNNIQSFDFEEFLNSLNIVLDDQGIQMETEDNSDNSDNSDNIEQIKENMKIIIDSTKKDSKIMICWPLEKKLGKNIRDVIIDIEKEGCNDAIVIIDDSITPHTRTTLKNLSRINKPKRLHIDVYTLIEAQINITMHKYQPEFEVCTEDEKKLVLERYGITGVQCPHIKSIDPIVRHFGVNKGQMFKITRKSTIQPDVKTLYYRIVS